MNRIQNSVLLALASALAIAPAHAQSTFDINIGFGAFQDSAAPGGIDIDPVTGIFFSCTAATDPTCVKTTSLNSFQMGVGGSLMLWKRFGVGADVSFQPAQQTYANFQQQVASQQIPGFSLNSRMILYDFDGIFQPMKGKKAAIQLRGGIGGANLRFYENQNTTDALAGATNFNQFFESANHFQVHGGVGVQFYLTDHFFIRPEFNVHYVANLGQFGRNLITQETVWIGYSFGGQ
jgi:hypothetical protein